MEAFYNLDKEVRLISFPVLYMQLAFFTSREVKALEELTWVGIIYLTKKQSSIRSDLIKYLSKPNYVKYAGWSLVGKVH